MSVNTKFCWSKEITLDLIELYEKYPILYLTHDVNYKNKNKRYEALEALRQSLCEKRPFAANQCLTVDDIKHKIHGLRTQHFKEVGKMNKSKSASGSSTDEVVQPKLWCYTNLNFLRDSDPVRPSTSNADEAATTERTVDIDAEEEIVFDGPVEEICNVDLQSNSSCSNDSSVRKRKTHSSKSDVADLISSATQALKDCNKPNEIDDLHIFGKTVEAELRLIKKAKIIIQTKRKIFNILQDARDEDMQDY